TNAHKDTNVQKISKKKKKFDTMDPIITKINEINTKKTKKHPITKNKPNNTSLNTKMKKDTPNKILTTPNP
uniref:hypothetical protein n=1 Tax=Salmonella sp. s59417 TaxID=3159716 RepID=UPI00398091D4